MLCYQVSLYCVRQLSFLSGPWVEYNIDYREQGRDFYYVGKYAIEMYSYKRLDPPPLPLGAYLMEGTYNMNYRYMSPVAAPMSLIFGWLMDGLCVYLYVCVCVLGGGGI